MSKYIKARVIIPRGYQAHNPGDLSLPYLSRRLVWRDGLMKWQWIHNRRTIHPDEFAIYRREKAASL
jgi:hypothetical protein